MKQKNILSVLIICLVFLNLNATTQSIKGVENMHKEELESSVWETDKVVLLNDEKEYVLKKFIERKFAGNLLRFNNQSNIFGSEYTSFCGDDARILLQGAYKFEGKDKISFKLYTIDEVNDGTNEHSEIEGKKILFQIIKKDEKFILREIEK